MLTKYHNGTRILITNVNYLHVNVHCMHVVAIQSNISATFGAAAYRYMSSPHRDDFGRKRSTVDNRQTKREASDQSPTRGIFAKMRTRDATNTTNRQGSNARQEKKWQPSNKTFCVQQNRCKRERTRGEVLRTASSSVHVHDIVTQRNCCYQCITK